MNNSGHIIFSLTLVLTEQGCIQDFKKGVSL